MANEMERIPTTLIFFFCVVFVEKAAVLNRNNGDEIEQKSNNIRSLVFG